MRWGERIATEKYEDVDPVYYTRCQKILSNA